jgi:predicted negative regulator of RcsB-dependent stress response
MKPYIRRNEIKTSRDRTGMAMAMVGLLSFGMLFAYVWQRVSLSQQLAHVEQLTQVSQSLTTEQKQLSMEVQRLNSWSYVEQAAIQELGLCYPEKDQVVLAILPPAAHTGLDLFRLASNAARPVPVAWSQP